MWIIAGKPGKKNQKKAPHTYLIVYIMSKLLELFTLQAHVLIIDFKYFTQSHTLLLLFRNI